MNAIWRELPNGLLRAVPNGSCLVGTDGFRSRYKAAYMMVYAKVDQPVNLSGTADFIRLKNADFLHSWDFFTLKVPDGSHGTVMLA